jgi:rare lipoprotein A
MDGAGPAAGRRRAWARLLVLAAGVMILSACAETQLLTHTVKRVSRASEPAPSQTPAVGIYKVGNPYAINGVWYYPKIDYSYLETGIASWYGPRFHGKPTANGETFDMNGLSAAHRTLPLPSIVRVTNLENGRSMKLRVNDRGPFAHGRIIDISRRGAQLLGFEHRGTARVRVEIVDDESRLAAAQIRGGPGIQTVDTPIINEEQAKRPGVMAESLQPPPGGRSAGPVVEPDRPVMVASRETVTDVTPAALDGRVVMQPVSSTQLFVQIGAFTQYQNAHQVVARLKRVGNARISSAFVDGKEFFRVRFGPIGSVDHADRILEGAIGSGYSDSRVVVD